jgi:hypothetical protein
MPSMMFRQGSQHIGDFCRRQDWITWMISAMRRAGRTTQYKPGNIDYNVDHLENQEVNSCALQGRVHTCRNGYSEVTSTQQDSEPDLMPVLCTSRWCVAVSLRTVSAESSRLKSYVHQVRASTRAQGQSPCRGPRPSKRRDQYCSPVTRFGFSSAVSSLLPGSGAIRTCRRWAIQTCTKTGSGTNITNAGLGSVGSGFLADT